MIKTLQFIVSAVWHRHAYIDLDGCLLERFRCPRNLGLKGEEFLQWWVDNLEPTPVVRSRLILCYVLHYLGVRLHVWTNRWPHHASVTLAALGKHASLFVEYQYHAGRKQISRPLGPVMDDQAIYLRNGKRYSLLVEQV